MSMQDGATWLLSCSGEVVLVNCDLRVGSQEANFCPFFQRTTVATCDDQLRVCRKEGGLCRLEYPSRVAAGDHQLRVGGQEGLTVSRLKLHLLGPPRLDR
jgi:hypothetical protein